MHRLFLSLSITLMPTSQKKKKETPLTAFKVITPTPDAPKPVFISFHRVHYIICLIILLLTTFIPGI